MKEKAEIFVDEYVKRRETMQDIIYKKATEDDIEQIMKVRLEMLRVVNDLPDEYVYEEKFVELSRNYFLNGEQTTILAFSGKDVVACATMSYIKLMPTFSHPTGLRGHLMNVYTKERYRRKGISANMINTLIEEARQIGATEISLDATEMGRPLYKALGFADNGEGMNMIL